MLQVSEQVGQVFTISVSPVPANGVLDAPPTYTSDTPGVVTITPAADGLSAVVAGAAPGTCTITIAGQSLGKPVSGDDTVQITVSAPPPPPVAVTSLHVTVGPVSTPAATPTA